jgi:hypothetical protein
MMLHSALSPDPVGGLLHHIDCVVMLLSRINVGDQPSSLWAAALAAHVRVVEVTLDEFASTEPKPAVGGRFTRVTLPSLPLAERSAYLNRELRRLGLIKPLFWLDDLAHEKWFCSSYAAFKIVALWNRDGRAHARALSQADAILLASDRIGTDELPHALRERAWRLPAKPADAQAIDLCRLIARAMTSRSPAESRLSIAILYDHTSTHTNTVREYLSSFAHYSRHHIFYVPASNYHPNPPPHVDLSMFDVIVIHYSIRLCFNTLLPVYARALVNFGGLKVCFIQDEYDCTETTRQALDAFGIHVLFTCVPDAYRERVYPSDRFPNVEFIQVLTGYVPLNLETPAPHKPFRERRIVLGYRGRALPAWYGNLSREKLLIGQRVRAACISRGIPVDIGCDEDDRIYGQRWYEFMANCRATLGTESGSNVFDDHGDIRYAIQRALQRDPDLPYETLHARYIGDHDGAVRMNQISPRVFEAIALRTALVLYEGEYSGVIAPNVHYIPLKKDLSNLDEVLERLADDDYLERLTARAWDDIVASGRYSYRAFVKMVDAVIDRQAYRGTGTEILTAMVASRGPGERQWQWRPTDEGLATFAAFTTAVIDFEQRPPAFAVSPAFAVTGVPEAQIVDVAPPAPVGPLQTVKWRIADALYRHTALYVTARTSFRAARFVLQPIRRGYRALPDLFKRAGKPNDVGP